MTSASTPIAPETIAYRQQLALHVLPKSPKLSIHHANRIRKLHPSLPALTPISCSKCENVSLHGRGSIRVARQAIVKACNVCGSVTSVPRPESRTRATFQSVRAARRTSNFGRWVPPADSAAGSTDLGPLMPVEPLKVEPQPQAIIQPKISPGTQSTPKSTTNKRQKAKGGLQGMLQRNREREAREAQNKNAGSNSLSSFLQDL
ncbi:hypothetical protein AG1IA_00583 [Rhizoctonia solani AG-1 IA]|uniref:Rpr2-domain-containing protein n=2 Tax=Rhizoctonia solani TaxID=456999 RepID=A0A8H8NQF9_9AGAM|nr:uncharacterized protein RhiXN_04494 [Rhizoctonia solani]ELU45385.1 hypothetical protein AG1IA_00583 [Rhizoctonia solani AG-1 IA]QRW16493.1 hypothetical protein RhiXN_04494 [Rhizoctonia solani]